MKIGYIYFTNSIQYCTRDPCLCEKAEKIYEKYIFERKK